jgi:hypothetical protein
MQLSYAPLPDSVKEMEKAALKNVR